MKLRVVPQRSAVLAVVIVVSAVAVSACSSSKKASASKSSVTAATSVNPSGANSEVQNTPAVGQCPLVSPDQVAAAFGGKVSTVEQKTTGTGNPLCVFSLTTTNIGMNGEVSVTTHKPYTLDAFHAATASDKQAVSVGGLGQGASLNQSTWTLQFVAPPVGGAIQAMLGTVTQTKAAPLQTDLVMLAKAVLANS